VRLATAARSVATVAASAPAIAGFGIGGSWDAGSGVCLDVTSAAQLTGEGEGGMKAGPVGRVTGGGLAWAEGGAVGPCQPGVVVAWPMQPAANATIADSAASRPANRIDGARLGIVVRSSSEPDHLRTTGRWAPSVRGHAAIRRTGGVASPTRIPPGGWLGA
jgi:hypothetical protein